MSMALSCFAMRSLFQLSQLKKDDPAVEYIAVRYRLLLSKNPWLRKLVTVVLLSAGVWLLLAMVLAATN